MEEFYSLNEKNISFREKIILILINSLVVVGKENEALQLLNKEIRNKFYLMNNNKILLTKFYLEKLIFNAGSKDGKESQIIRIQKGKNEENKQAKSVKLQFEEKNLSLLLKSEATIPSTKNLLP